MLRTLLALVGPLVAGALPHTVQAPTESPALTRALAAVRAEAIRADLEFLAGPELGGRGTPSVELEWAARFVEARVRRLGFEPGTADGFQHRFELRGRRLDLDASSLVGEGDVGAVTLEYGEDVFLRGMGDLATTDFTGSLVAVGDGSRRSLEQVEALDGDWALVADAGRGTAGAIRRALDAGAGGVLVTPGPGYAKAPYAERYGEATRRLATLRYSSPTGAPPEDVNTPAVLFVGAEGLAALLGVAGLDAVPALGERLELRLRDRRVAENRVATAPNVAALVRGSDPELAGQVLVLCAHLDHLGIGRDGSIFAGADDNASGSVGLLALAEAIAARGPLRRSILLLWVSGEESGLWGSAAWCRAPNLPAGLTPRGALNLDMIGRDAPATLWVTPTADHPAFNPLAALGPELASTEGFGDIVSQDNYWRASDHYSFASELRIPVLYLSSGEHDDYHKPSDVPTLIDYDKLERIVRLTLRILERSDDLTLEPVETIGGRGR